MDVAELAPRTRSGSSLSSLLPISRVIDISMELDANTFRMQVPDGFDKDAQFEVEVIKPYSTGDGQIVRAVHMRLHAGSHVDAPAHQLPTGKHIHELPIERFVGDALVVDFTDKLGGHAITVEDLEARYSNKIRKGDRILVRTNANKRYFDMPLDEWKAYSPGFTVEARHWLVERGVTLIGFDMYHGKKPKGESRNTSKIFPTAGVLTLPYLNNLDRISKERVTLICLPLAIVNVEATPVRAVVLED